MKKHTLTKREKEISKLIADGESCIEIAEKISVKISTVRSHVRNIHYKTNTRTLPQLVVFIREQR